MKTIWLVRHGETEFNVQSRLQWLSNSELTPAGLSQIRALSRYFEDKPVEGIFSRDLKRAQITADHIAERFNNLSTQASTLLRERSFGVYEGKLIEEYHLGTGTKRLELDFQPDGGESLNQVLNRASESIKFLKSQNYNHILVVAHGSFNKCFLTEACKLERGKVFDIKQNNCCINKLVEQANGTFALELFNFIEHLQTKN